MQAFFLSFFIWGISLTDPVWFPFYFILSRAFVLHILCWLDFYLGCFSYTSHAGFIFTGGVSLTHPVLASFLSGEKHIPRNTSFLSGEKYIPRWLHSYAGCFCNTCHADSFHVGSFSYTSLAAFIFMRWSLSYTSCASFSSYAGSFSYTSRAGFSFYQLRSFSYTSLAAFIFMRGVCLTHPVLP